MGSYRRCQIVESGYESNMGDLSYLDMGVITRVIAWEYDRGLGVWSTGDLCPESEIMAFG